MQTPQKGTSNRDRSPLRSPVRLYSPGTPSTPTTPSSSKTKNINVIGYVSLVGDVRTSSYNKNTYALMIFKTSDSESLLIKVMSPENEPLLDARKNNTIKLNSVAHRENKMFYNRRFGSTFEVLDYSLTFSPELMYTPLNAITEEMTRVHCAAYFFWVDKESQFTKNSKEFRNAILKDDTGELNFTVWGNFYTDVLQDEGFHNLADLNVKLFQGIKLETSYTSVVCSVEGKTKIEKPDVEECRQKSERSKVESMEKIINPSIEAVKINKVKKCNGLSCNADVIIQTDDKFVRCSKSTCGKRFLMKKAVSVISGVLDITVKKKPISLSFSGENICNIVAITDSDEKMEEKLLLLDEACVITYNRNNLINIEANEEMEDEYLSGEDNEIDTVDINLDDGAY